MTFSPWRLKLEQNVTLYSWCMKNCILHCSSLASLHIFFCWQQCTLAPVCLAANNKKKKKLHFALITRSDSETHIESISIIGWFLFFFAPKITCWLYCVLGWLYFNGFLWILKQLKNWTNSALFFKQLSSSFDHFDP